MARTNALSFIVCSALKRRYRDRLREGQPGMRFLFLKVQREILESRLSARSGHFFKPAMLASQFEALEIPIADETDVMTVDADVGLEEVVLISRRMLEIQLA
jgi:gluconokinase